ncbi:hypothetical protein L208DRAFT_1551649, partial [Tricholoma matsutake]
MAPYLLDLVTQISISIQSLHHRWKSTTRDFTMSLAPHPPMIMSAVIKKLEYANDPLYLCFQSLSQYWNVFLWTPCICLALISVNSLF